MGVHRKLSVSLLFWLLYPSVQIPAEDLILHDQLLARRPPGSAILERVLKTYEGKKGTLGRSVLCHLGERSRMPLPGAVKLLLQ